MVYGGTLSGRVFGSRLKLAYMGNRSMKIGMAALLVTSVLMVLVLAALSSPWAKQQKPQRFTPDLPMTFDHQTHREQQCIDCHHNFVDDSGQGLCLECHVSDRKLSALLEQQFHELCQGCHIEQQVAGQSHGPIRVCLACHQEDEAP